MGTNETKARRLVIDAAARKGRGGPNKHVTRFRSDSDLYRWRYALSFAIPMTALSYWVLDTVGVPFRYSPAAVIPALCLILFFYYRSWRDRKSGRRFGEYIADDLDA